MTEVIHPVIKSKQSTRSEAIMVTSRTTIKRSHPHDGTRGERADLVALSDERQRREERILDTAAALLVRWGYRKTTIDDVAREAGVGKGTIYLHWKDKSALFTDAIWRASRQVTDDMLRRMAADPEGGRFHRVWAHGMLALLANPLLAALMTGTSDLFQGLLETMPPETLEHIAGNGEEHIAQLQRAGLIRADLPVSVIVFLIGSLKIGIIHVAELMGQDRTPSSEQLAEAISDLMRRWLEPVQPSGESAQGKDIMADWLENTINLATQRQQQG
jgi:AcrR family transcriptional regulator